MPAVKATRPATRAQNVAPTLMGVDPAIDRVVGQLAVAINRNEAAAAPRAVFQQSLALGANRISHGLGRRARGATLTPTVADATFAWSFGTDNDTQAIVTLIGVAQPNATIEVF